MDYSRKVKIKLGETKIKKIVAACLFSAQESYQRFKEISTRRK